MKKILTLLLVLAGLSQGLKAQLYYTVYQPTYCITAATGTFQASITNTPAGATSFSWTVANSGTAAPNYSAFSSGYYLLGNVGAGIHTIVCNAWNGSTFIGSTTSTFALNFAPIVTAGASTTNICFSGTATLSANGAASYSWYPGAVTSPSMVVSPTVSTCYTVLGSNGTGCNNGAIVCINVAAAIPTVVTNPSSSFSLCNGSAVMNASGAASYAWSNGSNSAFSTATALGCYTVIGTNGCGSDTAVICATGTLSAPAISVSGNTFVCAGQSGTFSLSGPGANSYPNVTWNGPGAISPNTGTQVVITPTAFGCYTVIAQNNGCNNSAFFCVSIGTTGVLGISNTTGTVCASGGNNLFAYGASTYTWTWGSGSSNSSGINVSTPGCYTVSGTNACGISTASTCIVSISNGPTVSIAQSANTICANTQITFTASGATSYSWLTTSSVTPTGTNPVFSTSASFPGVHCATLIAWNGSGCTSTSFACYTVTSAPSLNVSQSGPICIGNSAVLSATGAQTFTWSTGQNGSSISVSPVSNTCYTVMGISNGCNSLLYGSTCVTVMPPPAISISSSTLTTCVGGVVTLTASGASIYSWSNMSVLPSIAVSPTASTCYTVFGTSAQGCQNSATVCLTVLSLPSLNITGNNTVCLGTSANFTASGATSYLWSTSSTNASINILASTTTVLSVSGPGANGCTGSTNVTLTINPNCSDVWPGDANSDGSVSGNDILELGLQFNATGAARSPGGNTWAAQYANNWTGNVSSGKNKNHADCNGDGVVNNGDTLAINNNWALTHAFKPGAPATDPDIRLETSQSAFYTRYWNTVDVVAGSVANPNINLYGLIFDLNFDASVIEPDSIYLKFTSSAFNSDAQYIMFRKTTFSAGKIYVSAVRTDQQNITLSGKFATLHFKVAESAPEGNISFNLSNVQKMDNNGNYANLNPGTVQGPVAKDVGINETTLKVNAGFYPNPAAENVTLYSTDEKNHSYVIRDLTGRVVMTGEFKGQQQVNTQNLSEGVYVLEMSNSKATVQYKLAIQAHP